MGTVNLAKQKFSVSLDGRIYKKELSIEQYFITTNLLEDEI
jgi:hypothetical protein